MNRTQLKRINKAAIDKMQETVNELKKQMAGKTVLEKSRILAKKSQLELQINAALMTQAHIEAGTVTVTVSDGEIKDLRSLADKIDAQIVRNAKFDALLSLIPDILDASNDISTIIDSHITSS